MSNIQQKSVDLIIINQYGIHARPAALLAKVASKYESEIIIEKDDVKISGKSIMGLLTISAGCGTKIKITAEGSDSEQAIAELQELIQHKFYEE